MSFIWPFALVSLLLVPVAIWAYVRSQRRVSRRAGALADSGFRPLGDRSRWRLLTPSLVLSALVALLLGAARPTAAVSVPVRSATVILAFDVSNSMRADDVKPTRIDAAKAAATAFVKHQPAAVKIGVVAFNDGGVAAQQPTLERDAVLAAIDRLSSSGSTSLGSGLYSALSLIAGKPLAAPTTTDAASGGQSSNPDAEQGLAATDIGYHSDAAIVLLSDGEERGELKPSDVASLASNAGVKIHTVGIGSTSGTVLKIDGFQVATKLDEASLQEIAKQTDGKYYPAADAESLQAVYRSLDVQWHREAKRKEITALFAAAALVLLTAGVGLSLARSGRVI